MNKKTGIIIGVLVVAFLALVGVSLWQKSQEASEMGDYRLSTITDLIDQKDKQGVFADGKYDFTKVIPANEDSGNLPENVNGDPKAPVVIVEYADYQCDYCAPMNPYVNKIVEEYDGKVAVVMRTYILSYHNNGVAAAAAANAAAIQGYWEEYKDLLFANQNEWFSASAKTRQKLYEQYFETVTKGKGDLDKFREDMKSDAVKQKIAFDMGIGDKIDVGGTPYFYLDGEWIENKNMTQAQYADKMREVIDAKLKKLGIDK